MLFCMPLEEVYDLVFLFMEIKWVLPRKYSHSDVDVIIKLERILAMLKVLSYHSLFRTLKSETTLHRGTSCILPLIHWSHVQHKTWIHCLSFIRRRTSTGYEPVWCELSTWLWWIVDVVHVKWSQCPAGYVNHLTGKEGFPSLVFEVIAGFDCQILGVP